MIDLIHIAHAAEEVAQAEHSTGVLGTLGINGKQFIGQLINFGVALLVLWKWVFTPVAKKLTERTEKVEKAMRDAASTEKEKLEFGKWKETEMTRVRSQAQAIVTAAQSEAGKAKQQIVDETKAEQQKLVEQAKNQIESEKQRAVQEAKGELADLVTSAAEKILRKKLDANTDRDFIKESLKSV